MKRETWLGPPEQKKPKKSPTTTQLQHEHKFIYLLIISTHFAKHHSAKHNSAYVTAIATLKSAFSHSR